VYELAVVVDLAGEVGVVLLRRLEHDLYAISLCSFPRHRGGFARTLEALLSLCEAR
jgi:hypothetical protein